MAESPLVKKLQLKSNMRISVVNAPAGYMAQFAPLPQNAVLVEKPEGVLDFVQVFVKTKRELEKLAPEVIRALKKDGLLWISYPKGGSKVATDLNRDILWEAMRKFGMAGVSMISIDNVWSAMRFRPEEKVGN